MAIRMCRAVELAAAVDRVCTNIGATSCCSISRPSAPIIPTDEAPSQYASKLGMGRGREINRTAMPRRTGSVAAPSANTSSVVQPDIKALLHPPSLSQPKVCTCVKSAERCGRRQTIMAVRQFERHRRACRVLARAWRDGRSKLCRRDECSLQAIHPCSEPDCHGSRGHGA